ncbi:MAG: alpha/beta hydrolase [Haloferacaceae archaeon]
MPTLPVSGGEMYYEDNGEGQPVVLLHGGWLDGTFWSHQVDRLSPEYRTIVPDLRGHGRTGATDVRRYSIDLFVDDVLTLREELSLGDPILCGLSLGSMVAGAYAASRPADVAGVVLAGPVRSVPPGVPDAAKAVVPTLPSLAATLAAYGSEGTFRHLASAIRSTTGSAWLSRDPAVREEAYAAAGGVSRREFRKLFGALYRFDSPPLSPLAADDVPTLVLYGDAEAPAIKRGAGEIADEADAQLAELSGAAHLLNRDAPLAFDRRLRQFLEAAV